MCTTPETYGAYIGHWKNFSETGKKFELLSDVTRKESFDIGHTYTESLLRERLNFTGEASNKHHWNTSGNRNIIWFFAHLRMIYYYMDFPDHDYYWFFDDDIRMVDWTEFLNGFTDIEHDFLAYFIFKSKAATTQVDVPVIDDRSFSGQEWFSRFPGSGDRLPPDVKNYFGSFFPIVRYSRAALETLLKIHLDGFNGWHEGFVPTILDHNNMKLSTIIQPDNTSTYFNMQKADIKHKNITVKWNWI